MLLTQTFVLGRWYWTYARDCRWCNSYTPARQLVWSPIHSDDPAYGIRSAVRFDHVCWIAAPKVFLLFSISFFTARRYASAVYAMALCGDPFPAVCKAEKLYLLVGGRCPMRFEHVCEPSPDWLVGVLARENRWMVGQRRQWSGGTWKGEWDSFGRERKRSKAARWR